MLQKNDCIWTHQFNSAFMASRIVSAASSESGIKGTLVLFPFSLAAKLRKYIKDPCLSHNENHKLKVLLRPKNNSFFSLDFKTMLTKH